MPKNFRIRYYTLFYIMSKPYKDIGDIATITRIYEIVYVMQSILRISYCSICNTQPVRMFSSLPCTRIEASIPFHVLQTSSVKIKEYMR